MMEDPSTEATVNLGALRAVCLSFDEVEERLSHGAPTWFVRGKRTFATFADHHHSSDRVSVWCAAPPGAQEALIEAAPERFFRPPYVGPSGWIGVYLDSDPDWDEVRGVLQEAYSYVASKLAPRRRKSPQD